MRKERERERERERENIYVLLLFFYIFYFCYYCYFNIKEKMDVTHTHTLTYKFFSCCFFFVFFFLLVFSVFFFGDVSRPCLKQKPTKEVGVEFYSDPNALAVAVNRKTVGRNGVFGTTEQRFNRGIFASPKNVQPGPGEYTLPDTTGGLPFGATNEQFPNEREITTGAFRSGTLRFGGYAHGSRKAMLEMQHEQERAMSSVASSSRNNASTWGSFGGGSSSNLRKKRYPESKYADPKKKRGGGFTSTSGRFGTKGERAGLFGADSGGPGPGGYSTTMRRSISNVRRQQHSRNSGTLGGSTRFGSMRNKSSASLGPGHGSMMKKTYNITYSMGRRK